ncbi:hypothetical protein GGS26DRAFT_113270 [Hypomontagnella submonticulosa]|nr:hypothetical protein GGS26DRAFT_113270 [Hypomontagnella submonticulosa]
MSLEQSRLSNGLENSQTPAASRIAGKNSQEQSRHSFASFTSCEENLDDVFTDMEDACVIEEATVMDAREVTIATPKLPEKSSLRVSRFLDSLKRISTEPIANPHDTYLSSEEDASSSADDFSDYDYDSTSEESEKSPPRRRSQEDTARAVSVIFVGKPCVVDLASGRRSVSPIRRPRMRSSTPSIRTSSIESRSSSHPPRKSSLASTIEIPKESPAFLNQDPFASSSYKLESGKGSVPALGSPRLPKTPTAAFHRFQKSISLVRKRSRPNLKDAASRDSAIFPPMPASTSELPLPENTSRTSEEAHLLKKPEPASATITPPQTPVTYNDIMRSARRDSNPRLLTKLPPSTLPPSPSPISAKRGILSGLNMSRRRSIRLNP